jgi:hypothetical protein
MDERYVVAIMAAIIYAGGDDNKDQNCYTPDGVARMAHSIYAATLRYPKGVPAADRSEPNETTQT